MIERVLDIDCEPSGRQWDCELKIQDEEGYGQSTRTVEDLDEIRVKTTDDHTRFELDSGGRITRPNLDKLECTVVFDRTTKRMRCKEPDMV